MENSILTGTKKILGLDESYTAFDQDVIVHINSAFSTVNQLGFEPTGFTIEDADATWSDLTLAAEVTNMVKTYIYLKVRVAFDPPGTGFLLDSMNNQIAEHEWRLSNYRELDILESEA